MQHKPDLLLFFFFFFFFYRITIFSSYAAAAVKNPDFEIRPANITANATSSIPGWSLNGTVWYVASRGGHALQLGPNANINQTIKATGTRDGVLDYIVSFNVGALTTECANNRTALNVTLRDSRDHNVSRLIYLQPNSTWERHSLKMPQMGGDEYLHIHIQSLPNATCWPLVDAFTVNTNQMPIWYSGNFVSNGGFEVGPALDLKSGDGIILNEEEDAFYSPIQGWSILGSVRYIDSRHYKVPRGEAAVELLTGGVRQASWNLPTTKAYTLNFTMGDANDSCVGDFVVYVQVGWRVFNFTMTSQGRGSAVKQSLMFRVDDEESIETGISFYSLKETRRGDGVLCGPVLDHISLTASYGESLLPTNGVSLFILFLTCVIIIL